MRWIVGLARVERGKVFLHVYVLAGGQAPCHSSSSATEGRLRECELHGCHRGKGEEAE